VYQEEGVPEYWIVDPEEKLVERWRPNDTEPELLVAEIEWHPLAAQTPLVIDLEALFRQARGEA
jgi:Uma2 family endonuclease